MIFTDSVALHLTSWQTLLMQLASVLKNCRDLAPDLITDGEIMDANKCNTFTLVGVPLVSAIVAILKPGGPEKQLFCARVMSACFMDIVLDELRRWMRQCGC